MSNFTLKEKAYKHLKELILTGKLEAGKFLTERILVELLQMSRTPIRSALERLESEGIVNYTPNKGIILPEFSIERAVDIYDIRMAVESHIVSKLSVGSLSAENINWFRKNLIQQKKYVDLKNIEKFTTMDSAFHRKLACVYGNKEIIQVIERLQDKLFLIAIKVLRKDHTRITDSYEDHLRIFESIVEGLPETAVKEIVKHLEFGRKILVL